MESARAAVALVGVGLRVPGANTVEQFWTNCSEGLDCLTRTPREALAAAGVSEKLCVDPRFVPVRPLLHDIEYFDADFFDMTPSEADRTDPAHRIFLECAWEALERAGIAPGSRAPVTGVYAGQGTSPGHSYFAANLIWRDEDQNDPVFAVPTRLGNFSDFLPTRVSFKLGLRGPSFGVQAACTTSLLAAHLAKEAIRRGECDVALAGGASVVVSDRPGYLAGVEGMLSAGGRVRTFDARADGTVFGSGVVVLALERLDLALAAGHPIHAVIIGSGVSNDGAPPGKASFIAPSPEGQTVAISRALEDAGIGPETIGYVEAHGTGTRLGDPIEIQALTDVYRRFTKRERYCAIGSVKPNVGHLRHASGAIGLLRASMALQHRILPPSIHFETPNPEIDFDSSPFFVPTEPRDWESSGHPRRAAVSAFGFGGTNAHVILEEPPPPAPSGPSRRSQLLVVSAKSERALGRQLEDLAAHLDDGRKPPLPDVAHTLRVGRKSLPHRAAVVVDTEKFTARELADPARVMRNTASTERRPVVFLFPGQGAQRPGMGRRLYETEAVYRESVDACAELLRPVLGSDIRSLLHAEPDPATVEALRQTINAQSALFVVEYAMARLFRSWGVEPQAMLGHSIGEYVAAHLAGVFSLADALRVVATRGRLMGSCDPGAMLTVFLSADEMRGHLDPDLELAVINAPALSVVSGTAPAIDDLARRLEAKSVATRRLLTSHAFHSSMMEPVLDEFRAVLEATEMNPPNIPFVANVTGKTIEDGEATDPDYWVRQLRHAVRFSDGVATLLPQDPLFVELGPGSGLSSLVGYQTDPANAVPTMARTSAEDGDDDEQVVAIEALARLWTAGADVDWEGFDRNEQRRKVLLPTYPFQRQRFWLEPANEPEPRDYSAEPALYEVGWREKALDAELPQADEGPWIVLHDRGGFGAHVVDRLRGAGAEVFEARDDDPQKLLASLASSRPGKPVRVLSLSLVTGREGRHNDEEAFDRAVDGGFHELLALTRAACRLRMAERIRVVAVADGLVAIDGEPPVQLQSEKAVLLGPCRVIPQEVPGLTMVAVDVPLHEPEAEPADWLLDAIVAEALASAEAPLVALRSEGRRVEEFRELQTPALSRMRLRGGGTVLITGAMGGLGLKVAADLFDRFRARLVLTSRWAPPPREAWAARAARDDKIGRALSELLELEARGAQIEIVQADTADEASMSAAIERARSRFGAVHGVVHAAGAIDDGPALGKTRESAELVFGAKVRGAFILERLLADEPLDFLVHFSSQAACMPGPGRVDYTAANSVLDSLARRADGTRGFRCAVGWGAWLEVGMAARLAAEDADARKAPGRHEGIEAEPFDHPLLGSRYKKGNGYAYRGVLKPSEHWVLDEHRLRGLPVMPGVGMIECVRAAFGDRTQNGFGVELSEMTFLRPLAVEEDGREIEVDFSEAGEAARFELRSRDLSDGDWTVHAMGSIAPLDGPAPSAEVPRPRTHARPPRVDTVTAFDLGRRWDCLELIESRGDAQRMQIRLEDELCGDLDAYGVHPAMLDVALTGTTHRFAPETVPFAIRSVRIHAPLPRLLFAEGRRRVVASENEFDVRLVDGAGTTLVEIGGLSKRPVRDDGLGPREQRGDRAGPFRLAVTRPGVLSSLEPAPLERRPPGPGEVEIEVAAAGLNFRDVLSAMGQLPGYESGVGPMGSECSGRVTAVGEGVTDLAVGRAVVTMASESLASHVTTDARLALPIPATMSIEEAAGTPITFLTADYALNDLARLAEGERVLIHSATGGVGLAAVQLARTVGAEIFATVGTPEKRDYLHKLGVEHVADSRSLDFADDIREWTGGEGVDIVLNSLAGDFIPRSIDLLRPFGRFLEIGKRDVYDHMRLDLFPFHKNLAYHAIDLGLLIAHTPDKLRVRFQELLRRFELGELEPSPTTVFPMNDPAAGFEHIARAQHIGKAVFLLRDDLAGSQGAVDGFRQRFGAGISVKGGLAVLRRLLSSDEAPAHVLVVPQQIEGSRRGSAREAAAAGRHRKRPALPEPPVAPEGPTQETLVRVWQDVLGVAPVGIHDGFFQLGGNSITAIQLVYTADQLLDVTLPQTAVFAHPTVARLAAVVEDLRGSVDEVDALVDDVESLPSDEAARLLDDVDADEGD